MVVTRQVAAGELLFVNKAFAVTLSARLLAVTVVKLERSSQQAHEAVLKLCGAGGATPAALPALTALVAASGERVVAGARQVRTVDRKIIKEILEANAHQLDTSHLVLTGLRPSDAEEQSGLFLIGSLINHSCRPTAVRAIVGDTMLVRASRDLSDGDEVTDSYVSVLHPSFERRQMLK